MAIGANYKQCVEAGLVKCLGFRVQGFRTLGFVGVCRTFGLRTTPKALNP